MIEQLDKKTFRRATEYLNTTVDPFDVTDIYRTLHPTTVDYAFFTNAHGVFMTIDRVLGHKTSLNKLYRIQIIQSVFADHNRIKLKLIIKRDPEKP